MILGDLCPACGAAVDTHSPAEGEPRQAGPGALCVCLYCGALNTIDEVGGPLRSMTAEEKAELPEDVRAELQRIEGARRQVMRGHRGSAPKARG